MQTKQSTEGKSKFRNTVKRRALTTGTLIVVLLLATPYFFYSYQGFPDTPTWESFFGTYNSKYYGSVQVMAWVFFGKLVPFFLLLVWFFTCRHWWYHAILVPICMYAFQIYNTLNEDLQFTDTGDFYMIAPIIFIMAIFTYTVRTRIFDKIHGIDLSELGRVNWKGEITNEEVTQDSTREDDDDDDDEPAFMA